MLWKKVEMGLLFHKNKVFCGLITLEEFLTQQDRRLAEVSEFSIYQTPFGTENADQGPFYTSLKIGRLWAQGT